MRTFLQIMDHVWRQGHGMHVNRYVNANLEDAEVKGWHYKCECKKEWSR